MTTLYELTEQYQRLLDAGEAIDDETGEVQPLEDALARLSDAIEHKAHNCAAVLQQWSADIDMLVDEEARLAAKRRVIENRRERLRTYVRDQMVAIGATKLKTPAFTLRVQPGRESVWVDNVDALPGAFRVMKFTPDKASIKAALKAGEEVEGARLVTGEPVLVVT